MTSPTPKLFMGFIAGAIASVFWGFHPVAIRYLVLEGVDPAAIADVRLFIGAFFLFIFLIILSTWKSAIEIITQKYHFPNQPVTKHPLIPKNKYFWLAVVSLSANFYIFHQALRYTLASDAILLEAFSPIVVLMLLMYFLPEHIRHIMRDPKMPSRLMLTVFLGSIGAAFILLNDPQNILLSQEIKFKGDILALFAMFFFGVFMFANHEYQRKEKVPPLHTISSILFFTALAIAPLVPWKTVPSMLENHWLMILTLGISSTGLAYVFWQIAAKSLEAVPLALLFFSLSSAFNVGIESLIFNLDLSLKLVIGAVMIISSAIATQIFLQRGKDETEGPM